MPESLSDTKREQQWTKLKLLMEQQQAVARKELYENNPITKVLYARQLKEIEDQIEVVEKQIEEGGDTHHGGHQFEASERHNSLQRDLPKIDFKKAVTDFHLISPRFNQPEGGAALFLLQQGRAMGAEYCLARIRDLLSEMTAAGNFKRYPVAPTFASPLDERGLASGLAGHFGVRVTPEAVEQSLQEVIERVCGAVQTGTIVLFELTGWDYYTPRERITQWFLKHFWSPLVGRLPEIARAHRGVAFVGVIVAETEIRKSHLHPSMFCTRKSFSAEKILELQLKRCKLHEISEWLIRFSKLEPAQIDVLAEVIYNSTKGQLSLVVEELKAKLA